MGDFDVGNTAVGAAVFDDEFFVVVAREVVVFKDGAVRVVGACTIRAVINELVVAHDGVFRARCAFFFRAVQEEGASTAAVLREDAVFNQARFAVDADGDRPAHFGEDRVFVTPELVRRELGDVDAAHFEAFAGAGQRARVFGDFGSPLGRVAAQIVSDGVRGRNVKTKAVVFVFRVFQGGGVWIIHVESAGFDVFLARHLFQRFVVDKRLLGIGGHAFFFRVGVGGADAAEALLARGFPQAALFLPTVCGDDFRAFQPDFALRFGLQGDVIAGDEDVRLAVDAAFHDDGSAVLAAVCRFFQGREGFFTAAGRALSGAFTVGGNPKDVIGRYGVILRLGLVFVV